MLLRYTLMFCLIVIHNPCALAEVSFGEGAVSQEVVQKPSLPQGLYKSGWQKLDGFSRATPVDDPVPSREVANHTVVAQSHHVIGARGWSPLNGFPLRPEGSEERQVQRGVPEKVVVPTSELVHVIQKAHQSLGIRPAFLMGLLHVETRLGANVGNGRYYRDMNPLEHGTFLRITQRLGLDPNQTPVSRDPGPGWGGAMGLAQFIPSTWMRTESCVRAHTGSRTPNPWNTRDAVFAAACLLKNLDGVSAEDRAARMYYAGDNWTSGIAAQYASHVRSAASQYVRYFQPPTEPGPRIARTDE